jgi:hypothetical protein
MRDNEIAVVIGHDHISKGAYSEYIKEYEFDYNSAVAKITGLTTYTHTPSHSYTQKMQDTYRQLDQYSLTLEMHFNAASESVQGVEALYYGGNAEGKRIAELYCELVAKEYGVRNRGAKPLSSDSDRGFRAVASGQPTGLILEPFFGSNSDCKAFKDKDRHAALMCNFISKI